MRRRKFACPGTLGDRKMYSNRGRQAQGRTYEPSALLRCRGPLVDV